MLRISKSQHLKLPFLLGTIFVIINILTSPLATQAQTNQQSSGVFSADQTQEFYYESESYGISANVTDDYVVDIEKGGNGKIYWVNRRQILVSEKGTFSEVFNLSEYKRVKQIYDDGKGRLWVIFIHKVGDPLDEILMVLNTTDYSKIPLLKLNISNLGILQKTSALSIFSDKHSDMHILGKSENVLVLQNGKLIPKRTNIHIKDSILLNLINWSDANSTISYENKNYLISASQYSNAGDVSMYLKDQYNNDINSRITTDRINTKITQGFGHLFNIKLHDYKTLIINNEKKILFYDLNDNVGLKVEEEIPDIFKDRFILNVQIIDNDLWIGTNKGLIKITKQRREFKPLLDKRSNSVRNIISIGNDSILIAHENGISLYNVETKEIKTRITDIAAYGLIQNKDEFIFNTYSPGLFIANFRNGQHWEKIKLEERSTGTSSVNNIYNAGNGNVVLITNNEVEIYNYNNRTKHVLENKNCPLQDFYSILDIEDELILTGDKGACKVDFENMSLTKDMRYPSLKISHIYKPTDSTTWIGTKENGLVKMNLIHGTSDTFDIDDGLLSLNVHSAFLDSRQRLWTSTDYGISVIDVNTNDIITLTTYDGIHENEMNVHSFLALPDSTLMYGTVDGVIHFSPNDIDLSFTAEELSIESLIYINTRTNKESTVNFEVLPKIITLESNFGDARIKVSSRFKNKSNNIRYLLSDTDSQEWQILKSKYLNLSQLKESKNTLYISYRIGLNEWSNPKVIEVIRKRPIYLRSSFYISCLSLLIISILLRFILLQRRTKKRNLEIEELVNSQTIELSKKIIELSKSNRLNEKLFSIIGHDLKSPLTSLLNLNKNYSYLVSKGEYQNVEKLGATIESNSRNLLSIVNRLLDWANSLQGVEIISSSINIESLLLIVIQDLEEILTSKEIKFTYDIDDLYFNTEKESLSIIIRNLIQNAIKYSFSKSEIILKSKIKADGNLSIAIIDFGIGINENLIGELKLRRKVFSSLGTNKEKGLGIGLSICLELANRIGGKIEIEKNTPKGTIINLTIFKDSLKEI